MGLLSTDSSAALDKDAPPELRIDTLLTALPAGCRVLDAGAGSGTFDYTAYPALETVAVDLRTAQPPGRLAKASAHRLPFADATFDVVLAHWLFEHVDALTDTYDEVRRVLRPQGLLAVAVPNSHAFEDRLYRFVSYVYKYAFLQFAKRVEHVQILTFLNVNQALYKRGFRLLSFREEAGGYCWLGIRQLAPFRAPILWGLRALQRLSIDLLAGANYRLLYRLDLEAPPGGYLSAPAPPDNRPKRSSRVGASPG